MVTENFTSEEDAAFDASNQEALLHDRETAEFEDWTRAEDTFRSYFGELSGSPIQTAQVSAMGEVMREIKSGVITPEDVSDEQIFADLVAAQKDIISEKIEQYGSRREELAPDQRPMVGTLNRLMGEKLTELEAGNRQTALGFMKQELFSATNDIRYLGGIISKVKPGVTSSGIEGFREDLKIKKQYAADLMAGIKKLTSEAKAGNAEG